MGTTALILAVIFFAVGLVGTVLPVLPGAVLIYGGMLVYGIMTQFATLDGYFFLLQGFVLFFILSIDYFASALGAKNFDDSKQAAWGAVAGTILGVIFFGPLGIIIGPFLGAVAGELIRGKEINQAARVGFGTLLGILGGTLLKLAVEILMIIYFFMKIW